ncbi:MAG: hypothetical protein VX589_08970 [Myxococcota bacterium]|nr:hypothetical protein [Myxococcota bacterium]
MQWILCAIVWLPHVHGSGEVTHDLGLDTALRGTLALDIDLGIAQTTRWQWSIFTSVRTIVRENTQQETFFRISPEQVHYPVGTRVRWRLNQSTSWGLVAFHQSNHDVDTTDADLNTETISYEVYGAEYQSGRQVIRAGVYYDRGTRLDKTLQNWPFNYYLAGIEYTGRWPITPWLYLAGRAEFIGHRNANTPMPHITMNGHGDLGVVVRGNAADTRFFLRIARLTDYPYLGAPAHQLLSLGVRIGHLLE